MKVKVGVTEVEFNKAQDVFLAAKNFECIPVPEDEMALSEAIFSKDIKHVIIGGAKYKDALYKSLATRSVIARFGVGHDGVNKKMASANGIFCTYTPGVLDDSVAEYTICLLLSAARQVIEYASQCKMGNWRSFIGAELKNKKLAVIGCGPIGRRVAQIASLGFQMKVIGCEIADLDEEFMKKEYGFTSITKDFREAIDNADFVSLHIPNNPANYHFMNEEKLGLMPVHGLLINTSRGAIIDEDALFKVLTENSIGGAVLDVFENEPYTPVGINDLRTLENVVMLPHLGSSTKEACDKMAFRCLENLNYAENHNLHKMDLLNKDLLGES
jgi:lactate dehydrogenase-like 2-hydroxyacid dehydrogenase